MDSYFLFTQRFTQVKAVEVSSPIWKSKSLFNLRIIQFFFQWGSLKKPHLGADWNVEDSSIKSSCAYNKLEMSGFENIATIKSLFVFIVKHQVTMFKIGRALYINMKFDLHRVLNVEFLRNRRPLGRLPK